MAMVPSGKETGRMSKKKKDLTFFITYILHLAYFYIFLHLSHLTFFTSDFDIFRDSYWNSLPSYMKRNLGLTFDSDGEFYMCFNRDFLK